MVASFSKNTIVPLLLRFALAAIFIFHGWNLIGPDKEWGANWMKEASEPLPAMAQLAVAWGELLGGVALAAGLLTRLAAAGIMVIMIGAVVTVHWPHGFDIQQGGFEYNFAIIVMCICLVLGGPGPISVDRFFSFKRT